HKILLTTALVVVIPVVFFLVLGCVKAPEKKIDFGSEVSQQDIDSAIEDAVPSNIDFTKVKVGQFVKTEKVQDVRGGYITPLLDDATTIISKTEETGYFNFEYFAEIAEHNNDGSVTQYVKSGTVAVGKPKTGEMAFNANSFSLQISNIRKTYDQLRLDLFRAKKVEPRNADRVTFHNLQITRGAVDVPARMKKFEDCQGVESCQFKTIQITYDIVEWTGDEGEKIAVKLIISPDLYYLRFSPAKENTWELQGFVAIQQCVQQSIKIDDQRVLVNFCSSMKDFQFYE
ncbi:MAG: hypothetical protein AB7O96_14235, partial [Pseudobdellovibrionaceae bacterium]